MSKYKMISLAVPNVPWQDKPENHEGAPLWRYTENPVIGRNPVEELPESSTVRLFLMKENLSACSVVSR